MTLLLDQKKSQIGKSLEGAHANSQFETQFEARLDEVRRKDLIRFLRLAVIWIICPLSLYGAYVDYHFLGKQAIYVALRFGFIALSLLVFPLFKTKIFSKHPFWPLLVIAQYFCLNMLFLIAGSGYENSLYWVALSQFLYGLPILPLTVKQFFCITLPICLSYPLLLVLGSPEGFNALNNINVACFNNLNLSAVAVFFIVKHLRDHIVRINLEREDDLINRDAIIAEKAKELIDAKVSLKVEELRRANLEKLNCLAAQVSHDIRSPLVALDMVSLEMYWAPEDWRTLARSAIDRIKDISNILLSQSRSYIVQTLSQQSLGQASLPGKGDSELLHSEHHDPAADKECLISSLLESLISEKRAQYRGRTHLEIKLNIDSSNYCAFAKISPIELKRVISNLINNAAESISNAGKVEVILIVSSNEIEIQIEDTGCGIPADILRSLMGMGVTYNKPEGTGLGLFHAKQTLEKVGGRIWIDSVPGGGTTVHLIVPATQPADWFASEIKIKRGSRVIVVDDEATIFAVWKKRFLSLTESAELNLSYYSKPEEFIAGAQEHTTSGSILAPSLILCDYEFLNSNLTGLDVIHQLGIAKNSILVTSRFEDARVMNQSQDLEVKVLPKALANVVTIDLG